MDVNAVLATVGLSVLGLVGYIALNVAGELAFDRTAKAVARRVPSFAERRRNHRGLMKSGVAALLTALVSGWIWLAAATSGYEDTADDARVLGTITAALTVTGCVLLAAWWRRSAAPRH